MIELMRVTGGFHSAEDMANACNQPGGLNKAVIARMLEKLKGDISSLLFSAVLCCAALCCAVYYSVLLCSVSILWTNTSMLVLLFGTV